MQRVPKAIPAAQLTGTAAIYLNSPAGAVQTINNLSLTNTSAATSKVTIHRVPSGGTVGPTNMIMAGFDLAIGQTYVPPQCIGLQLEPGMTLQAFSVPTATVTIAGGYYETTGSPS